MAIINVYNVRDGAQSEDSDLSRRTFRYKVETDDASHDPDICWTSPSIPAKGSPILRPGLSTLIVKSRRAEHDSKSPFFFNVTVEAEAKQPGSDSPADDEPEKWDVNISISGVPFEEPLLDDWNGAVVVNSAGQVFDPPIMETYFDEKIEVSFKTTLVDQAVINSRRGRVNSDEIVMNVNGYVRTFSPSTLWLADATQRTVIRPAAEPYWEVAYALIYRVDSWDHRPVDMGFYKKVSDKLVPILDKNNQPVSKPAYLDGSGDVLAAGDNAVRLTFKGKEEVAFAPLFTGL